MLNVTCTDEEPQYCKILIPVEYDNSTDTRMSSMSHSNIYYTM